eukprot:362621-Chlamydomonas_euryale.AAC.3
MPHEVGHRAHAAWGGLLSTCCMGWAAGHVPHGVSRRAHASWVIAVGKRSAEAPSTNIMGSLNPAWWRRRLGTLLIERCA